MMKKKEKVIAITVAAVAGAAVGVGVAKFVKSMRGVHYHMLDMNKEARRYAEVEEKKETEGKIDFYANAEDFAE